MRQTTRQHILACTIILVLASAVAALGSGKIPFDRNRNPIPNLKSISVDPTGSRCDSVTGTKGVFKTYSTAGYIGVELDAVDSAGAAVRGKVYVDGRQIAVGAAPFAFTNNGGSAFTKVGFEPYSAASRTLSFCCRRQ